jgi:hypothetical protein
MRESRNIATLRRRILVMHTFLAFVIVLGALTALVALRSTEHRSAQTRSANRRLGDLAEVRVAERELARTVRRFLLSGNRNEQLRAHAIASELTQLVQRADLGERAALLAEITAYSTTLTNLMSLGVAEPIARLDHFERELARARDALDIRFERLEAPARAKREAVPTTRALAVRAQWSIVVATSLGLLLVTIAATQAARTYRDRDRPRSSGTLVATELPSEPTTLT